jgi:hypothetical protein
MQTITFETVIAFGKHKGLSVNQILEQDPNYVIWLLENISDFYLPLQTVKDLSVEHPCFKDLLIGNSTYKKKVVEKGEIKLPNFSYGQIDRLYHTQKNEELMPEYGARNPFGDPFKYITFSFSEYPQWIKNVSYWEYARIDEDENGIPQISICLDRLPTILKYEGEQLIIAYEADPKYQKHNKYNPHQFSNDKLLFQVKADEHEFLEVAKRCIALNMLMIR